MRALLDGQKTGGEVTPVLICDGASDLFLAGQAKLLYDHLTCPRTILQFTAEEGADAHCQAGAQRLALARIYNWLYDTLANSGPGTGTSDANR